MFKSALSLVLAVSMFFFAGCYEVVTIPRENYETVKKYDEVRVLVDTSGTITKYRFSRGMCVVQKDTLIGTGTRITDMGDEHGVTVEIPTSRISVVEVSKLDLARTMIVVGAAVFLSVGVYFLAGAPGASGGPGQSAPPNPQ